VAHEWKALIADPLTVPKPTPTMSLAFSPDSLTLAVGASNMLAVWDIMKRERPVRRIRESPETTLQGVAFSPDGQILVVGGGGGGLMFWDVASLRALTEQPLHSTLQKVLTLFTFKSDCTRISTSVVGGFVGTTIMLRRAFPAPSPLSRASQIANRNLSLAEWQQFFPSEPYRKTFPDLSAPDDSENHYLEIRGP
jgi:WD40 repeat protein